MDKLDKIQQLHRMFKSHRRPVSICKIAHQLDCTEKTAKRAIIDLRDRFLAPIEYSSDQKGWHYDRSQSEPYELPGMWLTSKEIEGFALILKLLESIRADVFGPSLKPIENHILKQLHAKGIDPDIFTSNIKLIHRGDLHKNYDLLVKATDAINSNVCLVIVYKDYKGSETTRTVSPLTLVHYCDNWYLDAWCHKRKALRTFQLTRIQTANILKDKRHVPSSSDREQHFASSYGIFAGKAKHTAKIWFSAEVAREVAAKEWHPEQTIEWLERDELTLSLPYNDDRELLRDILKYGHSAEVLAPSKLRNRIRNTLRGMWELYK